MLLVEYISTLPYFQQEMILRVLKEGSIGRNKMRYSFYKNMREIVDKDFMNYFAESIPNYDRYVFGLEKPNWKNLDLDYELAFYKTLEIRREDYIQRIKDFPYFIYGLFIFYFLKAVQMK